MYPQTKIGPETRFLGIAVAPGVGWGPAVLLSPDEVEAPYRQIRTDEITGELARFESALLQTRDELLVMQRQLALSAGADATIFDAHLLVLSDRTLLDEVRRCMEREKANLEFALHKVAAKYCRSLKELDDPYFRERVADIEDVTNRVLRRLTGRNGSALRPQTQKHVLVTEKLAPSDTALLDRSKVLGFATERGGMTSHSAILARSLGMPSISGIPDITSKIHDGQLTLIDGYRGLLILDPSPATFLEYKEFEERNGLLSESLAEIRDEPGMTSDDVPITLSANIKTSSEVDDVKRTGADGVGLFRSEFLFLGRDSLPDEEEQYKHYRDVVERCRPQSVIIRTLDIGGDKVAQSLNLPEEDHPFLGLRAIRLCLGQPSIFRPQLRAILRASAHGNARLMYPMISGLSELQEANAILEECKAELRREGHAFNEDLEVGVMIEVPSAALIVDLLAKEVKFFSIGTNDLIQYTIAIDRMNDSIARLYEPTHPAIVRLIRQVTNAGRANGIWTGVCGEAASDLTLVPLLVGLGVTELSASPIRIPHMKMALRSVSMDECRQLAEKALKASLSVDIQKLCTELARSRFGNLLK
jgi:phosphoenolpyruvate-protein phosphotransferase (PTS system enzyme I)